MEKLTDLSQQFMARHKNSSLPAYLLLKEIISSRIQSGQWSPGETIPSENELAQALDLSRMTVNKAVREISRDGLLVRVQGAGTFVAEHKTPSALLEVRNIADNITDRGHTHSSLVLRLEELDSLQAGRRLDPALGSPVFRSVLVHYDNENPIQWEERYVNAQAVPHYLDQDFTAYTPNAYLERLAPITRGTHSVEAVLPTPEQAEGLNISPAEPCLLLNRSTWSGDKLISQVSLLHPGSRNRLEGSFEL